MKNGLRKKVENKFNVYGWFKCNIRKEKFYEIIFGNKITLSEFLKWVRDGDVVFDTRFKEKRPDGTDRLRHAVACTQYILEIKVNSSISGVAVWKIDFKNTSEVRKKIVDIYTSKVHGKKADTTGSDPKHSGKEGHWLEKQMGVEPNASNTPDLYGYEMKNHSNSVVTLGSWDPNYWVFRNEQYGITRDDFLKIFGKPNPLKNNRMSWSGTPVPKINGTNFVWNERSVFQKTILFHFFIRLQTTKEKTKPPLFQRIFKRMIWKYAGGTRQAKNHCMKSLIKNLIKTDGSHALEMTAEHTIRFLLDVP